MWLGSVRLEVRYEEEKADEIQVGMGHLDVQLGGIDQGRVQRRMGV